MTNSTIRPSKAGAAPKRKRVKGKGNASTPISNVAGSKLERERIRELDKQRQKELKEALIAELKANPTGTANTDITKAARLTKSKTKTAKKKKISATGWEGEKSEDILDSPARLVGSAFSGKRGR
jgi:hypothetical protein